MVELTNLLYFRQHAFDIDRFNVLLAEWLASDDQPFTLVESPIFRNMLSYLNPSVTMPSAVTARNQIVTNYNNNYGNLKAQLDVSFFFVTFFFFIALWSYLFIYLFFLDSRHSDRQCCQQYYHDEGNWRTLEGGRNTIWSPEPSCSLPGARHEHCYPICFVNPLLPTHQRW